MSTRHNVNVSRSRIIGVMRVLAMLVGLLWFGAIIVRAADRYVAQGGQTPAPDYESWATAASNIQDAITVASGGETVWVSNGVYETGGVTNWPSGSLLTNRVAITNAITVRSANNDPTNTIIKGARNNGTNGPAAVRCVYMADGSALIGFMLTNGATRSEGASGDKYGGGVYCQSTAATISNCVIVSNLAYGASAGVYQGTLYNCQVTNNESLGYPAGAYRSILYNCTIANNKITSGTYFYGLAVQACTLSNCTISGNIGGNGNGGASYDCMMYNCTVTNNGAWGCGGVRGGTNYNCTIENNVSSSGGAGGANNSTLYNCILRNNYSGWQDTTHGGGARGGTLYNCLLVGNGTSGNGGGVSGSTLYNCLIVSNRVGATGYPDRLGGGAYNCTLYNCTIVSNWIAGAGTAGGGVYTSTLYNCISWDNEFGDSAITAYYSCGVDYSGDNNISNYPLFVNSATGNYRVVTSSPCVNTGSNQNWMTNAVDLDGNRRIDRFSGRVDMGAYEFFSKGTLFRMY